MELDKKFAQTLVYRLIEGCIRAGAIDPTGKSKEELLVEFLEILNNTRDDDIELILDHRPSILEQARIYQQTQKLELACVFYAIWFEHWINALLHALAERKGMSIQEITQMIKDTNFDGKVGWLLRVFDAKPIAGNHSSIMRRITDLRNGFVHYKGKPNNDEVETNMQRALEQVEKTVKYLRGYENRHIYKSERKRIRKLMRE